MRRERGFAVNPWADPQAGSSSPTAFSSTGDVYPGGLIDALRDFRPGSLLILDEAHHAAPASGRKYADRLCRSRKAVRESWHRDSNIVCF